ncbi:MAG: DUF433 domain-containing protein [Caldilineaceae bacterium]|nr:DUF433 domain-containing protein [Caldilineaceae bacterium]HRJ42716.1 DUF433 domain-containing protein [Caldilineaceae bacterium]
MLDRLIVRDNETLGGMPVFAGTRVPIQTMIEYMERGFPLEEFLDDFPTISLEQAQAVLRFTKQVLMEQPDESVAG